jgi:hypothetical protein
MPVLTKRSPKFRLEFVANKSHSVHGGLPAVEALCQQFGLWEKLRAIPGLDCRKRKNQGYSAELMVAQLLYSLTSGGSSLADAERLNEEPLARLLARVPAFADQTTVGQWLRTQTPESIAGLWQVIEQFVMWVLERTDARRWTYCGRGEVFFDDTQIEVKGRSFEGAKLNYEGNVALSWQTFWWGPFLLEAQLNSPGDLSAELPGMLERHRSLWQERAGEFLADSASSAGHYLRAISQCGFKHWSVSYNKWVEPLERLAAQQPEAVWSGPLPASRRDGRAMVEQHCRVRYQPEGCSEVQTFAVVRFKGADEFFWQYRFVVCDGHRPDAAAVFARHRLKGDKENQIKELLRGLDLHHPPCAELNANRMFYAIGALAYNLLIALKLLHLPDDCQSWQLKTLLRQVLLMPAKLVRHARVLIARVQVPALWLCWWRSVMGRLWLEPQPGRPSE